MGRAKAFEDQEALNKAMVLFWEKGYANTSLKELLSEMNILNGSFYNCFGNKKTVFIKALEAYQENSLEQRRELFASGAPFKENLRSLFTHSNKAPGGGECPKGCFLVNSITADLIEDKEIQEIVSLGLKDFTDFLEHHMTLAVQSGELDSSLDVKKTTAVIFAYMQGLMKLSTLNNSSKDMATEVELLLSSLGV